MTTHTVTGIATEQEYQSTLAAIRLLEDGLIREEQWRAERDPLAHQLTVDGIEGFLEDLREQAADYEARHAPQKEDDDDR